MVFMSIRSGQEPSPLSIVVKCLHIRAALAKVFWGTGIYCIYCISTPRKLVTEEVKERGEGGSTTRRRHRHALK